MMEQKVMVSDANAIAMIATVRSLGRAGYKVHAVSARPDALGFKSAFTSGKAVHPPCTSPSFIPWLQTYVADNSIEAIICSEEFLHGISEAPDDIKSLVPDLSSDEVRKLCLSKAEVWTYLSKDPDTSRFLPASGILECENDIQSLTESKFSEGTIYLKLDKQYARDSSAEADVIRVTGRDELTSSARSCLQQYSRVTWQKHVSGLQVGVSLWRHDGEILAENMVRGLHLYPYYAGNMSLRESWWHEGVLADARMKLDALGWTGVAMMEYIWNPDSDEFWFIELNPRFWGYLHLDLLCGKDFPRWQLDAHFGGARERGLGPPKNKRVLRYAPGEVIHLGSRVLSSKITFREKLTSAFEFLALGISPKISADLWFPKDKRLYLYSWIRFLRELPARLSKALRGST